MKKILLLLLLLLSGTGVSKTEAAITLLTPSDLPKVVLYVYLDPNGVSDPTKSAEIIYNDLKGELEKTNKVTVLPFEETNKILRRYIRENTTAETAREKDLGFTPKSKDLIALTKEAAADYILYLNARVTSTQQKLNIWTGLRTKRTILFEMILTDKEAKNYLIDEVFSEAGSAQGTSYDRAFNKALAAIMEKINFSKIDFKKPE